MRESKTKAVASSERNKSFRTGAAARPFVRIPELLAHAERAEAIGGQSSLAADRTNRVPDPLGVPHIPVGRGLRTIESLCFLPPAMRGGQGVDLRAAGSERLAHFRCPCLPITRLR